MFGLTTDISPPDMNRWFSVREGLPWFGIPYLFDVSSTSRTSSSPTKMHGACAGTTTSFSSLRATCLATPSCRIRLLLRPTTFKMHGIATTKRVASSAVVRLLRGSSEKAGRKRARACTKREPDQPQWLAAVDVTLTPLGTISSRPSTFMKQLIISPRLWPYSVTMQKAARSWSTQVDLMDRYPEHQFSTSSAQQFKWVEQVSLRSR